MISVIICTYNRSRILPATLNSLAQMAVPPDLRWEVIVVDNNSHDDTAEVVADFARTSKLRVRYLFERKQGLSNARNRGILEAAGEVIAFTDDDVVVDRLWLAELGKALQSFECIAVGGKIIPVWNTPKPDWFYDERPYSLGNAIVHFDMGDTARLIRLITQTPFGANMAFRREAFAKYGLFRTDLGRINDVLMMGEETEFFRRLMDAGEVVAYTPNAIVRHPVEEIRTRKDYYQSWYFNFGKAQVRVEGVPKNAVRYFGVPRYLFRMIAGTILGWICTLDPKRRFRNKIHVYCIAGMMAESRSVKAS